MAVIGAADGNAVVACRRLDPDVVETSFSHDASIGDAVERDPAGETEILCARCLTEPACPLEQHFLGVVLDSPSHIFPMAHSGTRFPLLVAIGHPWLVKSCIPFGDIQ